MLFSKLGRAKAIAILALFCAGAGVDRISAAALSDFTLFARDTVIVNDRSVVKDGLAGANGYVELGCDAELYSNLRSRHNARMRSRAVVDGDVIVGGLLTRDTGTTVTGTITQSAAVDSIPLPIKSFSYGTTDFIANNGEIKIVTPGSYKDFHAYSTSRVTFGKGTYNFKTFICEPDVKLVFLASSDSISINVQNQISIGDRNSASLGGTNDPTKLSLYSNQTDQLYLGTDGNLSFKIVAPYALLNIGSRTEIHGKVYARKITIQPDAEIRGVYQENAKDWQYFSYMFLNTKSSGANISNAVYDFPVLVRLNASNFRFSEALPDGDDLRFVKADGLTALQYEIERWDAANKVADVWVRVDTVRGNDSTQYFLMQWGNRGAASQSGGSGVFDTANNFSAVWHLNQDPTGAILDATINGNNGFSQGGMAASNGIESIIGKGLQFDGTNDYCNLTNNASLQITGEVTVSAWVKSKANDAYLGIGGKICVAPFKGFGINKFNTNYFQFQTGNGTIDEKLSSNDTYTDTSWHYVAGVRRGGVNYLYMDGVQQTATGSLSFSDNGSYAFVGKHYANFNGRYWNGVIDEMCISRKGRSADWVKLCYENQKINQTLISFKQDIEDYSQWPYMQRIYFNTTSSGAGIPGDVVNFPFLVRLNSGNFNYYQSTSDGRDVRFADPDGTQLPYEIVSWDATNRLSTIWVKVPKIEGNSNTDYIIMYYGKSNVLDMQNRTNVWDSTFAGVWHLEEIPPDPVRDATINGNNGSSNGGMTAINRITAIANKGIDFDGTDDWIAVPSASSLNIARGVTVSAWFKAEALTSYARIAAKSHTADAAPFTIYGMMLDNAGHLRGEIADAGTQYIVNGSTSLNTTRYFFGTFTYDGSVLKLYINGKKEANTASHSGAISVNSQVFSIGRSGYNNNRFNGIIDEVHLSNVARDSNWIKLCYQNQRLDSITVQVTPPTSLAPTFDGSITNRPSDFDNSHVTMKVIHKGDDPRTDSLSHVLLRFDTRGATKRQDRGWIFENAKLQLSTDSLYTPLYRDSVYFGIYSNDRMLPVEMIDGFRTWREDRSTLDSTIKLGAVKYGHGISGQPKLNGSLAWALYDFQTEIKRLGFAIIDSVSWSMGSQYGGGSVQTYIKKSDLSQTPSDTVWDNNGTGVVNLTSSSITAGFESLRWIWIATKRSGIDTNASGVWGDFKVYGKRHRNTEVLFYQVKDDGIDTQYISFSNRGNNKPWRHAYFEQDFGASIDTSEGIGTEDFVKVFPGHDPYWNRYKSKYRSRSPIGSILLPGSLMAQGIDSVTIYFGIESPNRMQPAAITNGYYRFREDRDAANAAALVMNDTVYFTGIGGSAGGSGNYPYLLYNVQSEASRLGFGSLNAIRGKAGYCDGSDSVTVFVKTCTTTVAPTYSNWINNTGGVVQRVSHSSWSGSHYAPVNLTTDGSGGPASKIKWIWLSTYSAKGTGSTSLGAFADLRVIARPRINYSISLQNNTLSQAVQKALLDTTNPFITLLGVIKDSASTVTFISSRSLRTNLVPKLDLEFSDSKTMLSWQGRNNTLEVPKNEPITLAGAPTVGDGRYDRVVRFHTPGTQYASIADSGHIDYLQGMLSFYYQMDMGSSSDSGAAAEFFRRDVSGATQFKLCRDGKESRLILCFGDTTGDSTGPNRMIWAYADSFISSIDTITNDTTWRSDTLVNPFKGGQHYFKFIWDYFAKTASLSIDGQALYLKKTLTFNSNPQPWPMAYLRFGRNIDGYIENLIIRSKIVEPQEIVVARTNIDSIRGYLPFIQPGFHDSVDCIVICPESGAFRKECDRYAVRNISLGVRTTVITLNEINKHYSGSDEQERIRNFLKCAYLTWHLKYVILAGSADLIPSRKVAFESEGGHAVTTDRYYTCLEGTWNDDGDQFFAETEDKTDTTAELIGARFPAATWSELHTMVERSNMGFGLPPYKEQCTENSDTVMLTGIRMFNNVDGISDGQYYCNGLKTILATGAYTKGLKLRTYFPNDDPTNSDTDAVQNRLNKFIGRMNEFPGLWIHYGHGAFGSETIDRIGDSHIMLENNMLNDFSLFNRFRRMGHVRLVGCEAASQDLNSTARTFLSKPYGGALTYIGTSEYSYPLVESKLLIEECKNIADSSFFVWGDAFGRSAENVLRGESMGADTIGKKTNWVILSRNFMGDPLLPVRSGVLKVTDTLKISLSGNIKKGANSLTVTVTDKNNIPVENVQVGVAPLTVSSVVSDTLGIMGKTFADVTFGHCVTNRNGRGALVFTLLKTDSALGITATHPDFLSTRKTATFTDSAGSGTSSYLFCMFDSSTAHPYGNFNGIAEAGENINLMYDVLTNQSLNSAIIVPDTAGSKIKIMMGTTIFSSSGDTTMYRLSIRFTLLSCPQGAKNLGLWARLYRGASLRDSVLLTVPVSGPCVVPVITYLPDNSGDFIPQNGDNIRMSILLGNRYSTEACNVQCRLIANSSFVAVSTDTTAHHWEVRPDVSVIDTGIVYSIIGGYSESANGIIPAKLAITADNMNPDTIAIDLNPMNNLNLFVDRAKIELDYKQGVRITWNPVKIDTVYGRHSDFLGYVVMRKVFGDTTDNYTLLTPWAVTSTNYYHDDLPDTAANKFTYRIAAIDSSYNCSVEDTVDVTRPPFIKSSFPIRTAATMKAPFIGNHDKSGIAGIYTVAGIAKGKVIGFRSNGQESVVNETNDGYFSDLNAWQAALGDLNGDGSDEAVFVTDSFLVAWNMTSNSMMWRVLIADAPHVGPVSCYRKPIIADINNDDTVDVIVYCFDNKGNGATTLDIYSHAGTRLARRNFADCSYSTAITLGDFVPGRIGLEIAFISIPYVNPTNWVYHLYVLGYSSGNIATIDSMYICHALAGTITGDTLRRIPYSAMSAADLDNDGNMEGVFCLGEFPRRSNSSGDSLYVYRIDSSSGALSRIDAHRLDFMMHCIFGSTPALADVNNDDTTDIVMATDDSLYLLTCKNGILSSIVPPIHFGNVPANRLSSNAFTPQPIVAGNTTNKRVFVNHQGDGSIWAFDVKNAGYTWYAEKVPGFPLKTHGRISEACAVADLEGDDTLDLTAVDDAGYIYAWKLNQGSGFKQPWPVQHGNNWNTGFNGYKDPGAVGYVYEDWNALRTIPNYWLESGQGNINDSIINNRSFSINNGSLTTDSAGSRNIHFVGPSTKSWNNYTLKGKIKFMNTNARFGINVYSSYPDSAKKYSIIRRPDGKVEWLLYTAPGTKATLAVSDSVLAPNANTWYNYKIRVENKTSWNTIRAEFWPEGEDDPTIYSGHTQWDIDDSDVTPTSSRLKSGRIGAMTDSGTGTRYWGPITVVTNTPAEGAYMAYEHFIGDTIVDITPYTPRNWNPNYGSIRIAAGYDTTGFVFNKADTSLMYKHKIGTKYPAVCEIAPYTNLEWKDYDFRGSIKKPSGTMYDSVDAGIEFYRTDANNTYKIAFKADGVYLNGGKYLNQKIYATRFFNEGTTLNFHIKMENFIKDGTADSAIAVFIEANINGGSNITLINDYDESISRMKKGGAAIGIDMSVIQNRSGLQPIKIKNCTIEKIR